ncbi:MAG TPA: hypothetical protein VEX43_17365 [Chthoniobacterales bacterium]|nr:hypothetical protein [Chthoniobacterales bacterium]
MKASSIASVLDRAVLGMRRKCRASKLTHVAFGKLRLCIISAFQSAGSIAIGAGVPQSENSELWLKAALEEYSTLRKEMLLFLSNFRRDTTVLGALLGGALTVTAYSQDMYSWQVKVVVVGLPTVIFAYLLLQMSNLYMLLVEARQCAAIERKINARLGGAPMAWESQNAENSVRSVKTPIGTATTILNFALIAIHVGLTVFAYKQNFQWKQCIVIVHSGELFAILVCFAMYLIHQERCESPVR